MSYSVHSALPLIGLIAALAMSPVAPEAANVLFLVAAAAAIPFAFAYASTTVRRPIIWMPLLGLGLIGVSYAIGSGSINGLIGLAYFAPVFAAWPLLSSAWAARRIEGLASLVGLLALSGVAGAAVIAVGEVLATGTFRAGGTVANPIHFADVALLAGAISCAGLLAAGSKWRLIFAAGPLLALVPVVLSGTRGAVVAAVVMAAVAFVGAMALRLVPTRTALVGGVVAVALLALALVMGAAELSGIQRVLADMMDTLRVGVPTDESTSIRLQMYLGGLRAFLEAPLFGHGPLTFVSVANALADVPFGEAPHLHNDLADFAASGGLVGLLAYGLFMAAPIVEVLRLSPSWSKPRLLLLACTLVTGYFVMGLTNAMFGILNLTTYYAAICVLIGTLADRSPETPAIADSDD